MLSNEELNVIKERCEKATEGPWNYYHEDGVVTTSDPDACYAPEIVEEVGHGYNGEFIAHAREDIPKLLAEVERLREWNGRLLEYNRYYFGNSKRLTNKVYELEDEINELINRLDEAEGLLEDASDLLDDMYPYDTETYADITDYFEKYEPITRRDG